VIDEHTRIFQGRIQKISFNFSFKMRRHSKLLFTLVGIFTIGLQPQLQFQNIFAMTESNDSENENEPNFMVKMRDRTQYRPSPNHSQNLFKSIPSVLQTMRVRKQMRTEI
jgi:hypothetical protein